MQHRNHFSTHTLSLSLFFFVPLWHYQSSKPNLDQKTKLGGVSFLTNISFMLSFLFAFFMEKNTFVFVLLWSCLSFDLCFMKDQNFSSVHTDVVCLAECRPGVWVARWRLALLVEWDWARTIGPPLKPWQPWRSATSKIMMGGRRGIADAKQVGGCSGKTLFDAFCVKQSINCTHTNVGERATFWF